MKPKKIKSTRKKQQYKIRFYTFWGGCNKKCRTMIFNYNVLIPKICDLSSENLRKQKRTKHFVFGENQSQNVEFPMEGYFKAEIKKNPQGKSKKNETQNILPKERKNKERRKKRNPQNTKTAKKYCRSPLKGRRVTSPPFRSTPCLAMSPSIYNNFQKFEKHTTHAKNL